jgi:hypothetical protein
MLRATATVEGLSALGSDKFVLRIDLTRNSVAFEPILSRLEVEKLRALCVEALVRTQDQVSDPALLARVVP